MLGKNDNSIFVFRLILFKDYLKLFKKTDRGAALRKFQKDKHFQQDVPLLLEKDVSKAEVKEAGERLLVTLYDGIANNFLD